MSKRELKKYIHSLEKEELEDQILDLYERFKNVKVFYNFVFNPNEQKLLDESKLKISKEYFPVNGRKPKARRSVAQKFIKHFMLLGVENSLIADVMLYNIEIALTFSSRKFIKQEAFYKSMLTSFNQAVQFICDAGLEKEFMQRLRNIEKEVKTQNWFNSNDFTLLLSTLST